MATYTQIYNLVSDNSLRNRCATAMLIAANNMLAAASPTDPQKRFAKEVFSDPTMWGQRVLMAVLAANAAQAVEAIAGASDAVLQTAVNAAAARLAEIS